MKNKICEMLFNKMFWIVIFLIASCPAETSYTDDDESVSTFCRLPSQPEVGNYKLTTKGTKGKPGDRVPVGTSLLYSCPNIYYLDGNKEVTCSDGHWGTIPECKREYCKKNGQTAICTTVARCKSALLEIAKGENPQVCSIAGTVCCLSAPLPDTAPASISTSATLSISQTTTRSISKSCRLPDYPNDGQYKLKAGGAEPGDLVPDGTALIYSCSNGYVVDGNKEITCNNGHWGTLSECKREYCKKNGQTAICTTVARCKSALLEIANGENPQVCSIAGTVCCSSAPLPDTAPASISTSATFTTPPILSTSPTTTGYMPPDYEYDYINKDEKPALASCAPIPAGLTSRKTGRKAWDKCLEYQEKYVYPCERHIALGVSQHRVNRCNHSTKQPVAFGTRQTEERDDLTAKIEEFPYMALIGHGENPESAVWDCSAVIINEQFVITSGYCTSSVLYKVTYVRTATSNRTKPIDLFRIYRVARVIRHPKYKSPEIPDNIALLETETKMFLDHLALPACLPVGSSMSDKVVGIGYGIHGSKGDFPDHLQKTVLTKFSTEECLKYSQYLFPFNIGILNLEFFEKRIVTCYGNRGEARNICQVQPVQKAVSRQGERIRNLGVALFKKGNNGGAIHIHNRDIHCMYTVIGITSYAKNCEEIGVPTLYTSVAAYASWIEDIVWPD